MATPSEPSRNGERGSNSSMYTFCGTNDRLIHVPPDSSASIEVLNLVPSVSMPNTALHIASAAGHVPLLILWLISLSDFLG
jgi:hypothetical protein